ncbi:MAG: hypothetical protein ACT443_11315 [Gemmatimonadota bacterium]
MLLCAAAFASCDKNAVQEDEIIEPITGMARLKFFNFGVGAPGVNFYANDAKLTAVTSTSAVESNNGTNYGSAAGGGLYTALDPGQYAISGRIAGATDKGLPISNLSGRLSEAKLYSFYQSGFYDAGSKRVDAFMVEDNLPPIDYTVACVRFVNAIANSNAMTLYATSTVSGEQIQLGSEVAYKSAGAFTCLTPGLYNLGTRTAGSSTNAISRTGVGFVGGRVYTIGARGDMTSTSATNRPALDNTANR